MYSLHSNTFSADPENHVLYYSKIFLKYLFYYCVTGLSFVYSFCYEHPIIAYWLGVFIAIYMVYRILIQIFTLIKRFALFIAILAGYLAYQRGLEIVLNKDIPDIWNILATSKTLNTFYTNLSTYLTRNSGLFGLNFYRHMVQSQLDYSQDAVESLWNNIKRNIQ